MFLAYSAPGGPPPRAPLPLGRERDAQGGVKAVPPRARTLGYYFSSPTGLPAETLDPTV